MRRRRRGVRTFACLCAQTPVECGLPNGSLFNNIIIVIAIIIIIKRVRPFLVRPSFFFFFFGLSNDWLPSGGRST